MIRNLPVKELLRADIAGVRAVSGVERSMLRQMVMTRKTFPAHVTLVRALAWKQAGNVRMIMLLMYGRHESKFNDRDSYDDYVNSNVSNDDDVHYVIDNQPV